MSVADNSSRWLTNAVAVCISLASAAVLVCVVSLSLVVSFCFTKLIGSQGSHSGAAASAADCQARCLLLGL